MDPIEKNQQQKEDIGRASKGSDHSLDRQTVKKSREKGNQNRKSEKSTISSQKSPFKSKYASDKQFARAPFGHSGLSSKSFSRRHIQDNGTTFYAKPAKFGKIAKELKKQPAVDINLSSVKKGKPLKRYSPIHGSSDEQHYDDDPLTNGSTYSSSSIHISMSDKSSSSRSPENPPRHRKCYTNSKHAEFTKTLKLLDKGQSKDIKVSQSAGNLKRNSSSGDEMKYASADDIHSYAEKEDAILSDKDIQKSNSNIYKTPSKSENRLFNGNSNSTITITKPVTPTKEEVTFSSFAPDINAANILDPKSDCDQSKCNLNYFYKGTDNKMNLEGSDISGVKILLRGDLLGALNCLFPQLNLVASETNPKRPLLDPNFSYFSDSSDILIETFALARKLYSEQSAKADTNNTSPNEKLSDSSSFSSLQSDKVKYPYSFDELPFRSAEQDFNGENHGNSCKLHGNSPQLSLRSIVSAKDIHTSSNPRNSSSTIKLASSSSSQHILKSSHSEPKIPNAAARSHNTRLNMSLESFVDEQKRAASSTPYDRLKPYRGIESIMTEIEKLPTNCQDRTFFPEKQESPTRLELNSHKRSLYSSVLKSSVFKDTASSIAEKKTIHHNGYHNSEASQWCEKATEQKPVFKVNNDSDHKVDNFNHTLHSDDNTPTKTTPITDLRPPICYDLDELEKDITKSLEKLVDEADDPIILNQYNMQYSNASTNLYGLNNPPTSQYFHNQTQKFNETCYRKPPIANSGLNSLQNRLNFLRTKGRPSDFEQFFNPLAFNTQLTAQFFRQENITNNINSMPMDNMNHVNQLFPKADVAKLATVNTPYYQQSPGNNFERDIKELLTRYPQIMQNTATSINQQNILTGNNTNITANTTPFDLTSLYAHLATAKVQSTPLPHTLTKPNCNDENMILNQFIASQSLDNMYTNNAALNRYQISSNKFPSQIPLDYGKQGHSSGLGSMGMVDQENFPAPHYLEGSNCGGNSSSGIRTIISVSDLEKQALEQYRNSEESINARYDVLEKEAEEQYNNCLSQK
ncbi:uncharacterized protein LOC119649045 [Hermetia illucens]|uniref:uncharacterized protein LOC119649045 n=1 Tax=Hermetia illucens TaxID=343691 RepID=UPI0018CC4969|nr:uncharacterized protein LOC119649045 [Hermetia illucens]